jgi:hypothetical protein
VNHEFTLSLKFSHEKRTQIPESPYGSFCSRILFMPLSAYRYRISNSCFKPSSLRNKVRKQSMTAATVPILAMYESSNGRMGHGYSWAMILMEKKLMDILGVLPFRRTQRLLLNESSNGRMGHGYKWAMALMQKQMEPSHGKRTQIPETEYGYFCSRILFMP